MRRLKKMLALARDARGEQNTREIAESMLQKLLTREGLTLSDLEQEELREYRINYTNHSERKVLINLISAVLNKTEGLKVFGNPKYNSLFFEVTPMQYAEIKWRWSLYRTAFKREQALFVTAFIAKNKIYAENDTREPTPLSPEELEALLKMMRAIEKVEVHKQIENKS
jgi:hypothetical protein